MRSLNAWKWRQFWGRDARGKLRNVYEWLTSTRLPYVSFTLDPACPLRCNCCPWQSFSEAGKQLRMSRMSLDDFKHILSNIPRWVLIDFSGFGESATNPAMPDMLLWAYARGYRVQLFSTLVGLTRAGAAKLAKTKMCKFVVHMPDRTNFLYDADKWLVQLAFFDGLNFPTMVFGALGEVDPRILEQVSARGSVVPIGITDKRSLSDKESRWNDGPLKCRFAGKRLNQWAIWPNGDVSVCFFDYGHENVIGNLREQTYREISRGELLTEYRRRMLSDFGECLCRHCEESITQ